MTDYVIIVARQTGREGPWLVRCYDDTDVHVHSAEGGVSLGTGLREVERAIEEREARA